MKKAKQSRSQNSYSELGVYSSESGSDDSDNSEFDCDDSYNVSDSDDSSNSECLMSNGFKPTNNPKRLKRKKDAMHSRKRIRLGNEQRNTSANWKKQCAALLDHIFQSEDAIPFRYPVNLMEYPDYRSIIHYPMDLSTVRRELNNNHYNTPMDFCKDMRLIFRNSRTYNTNKNSRIYSMTTRLSDMFEEHITYITDDWRWMPTKKFEEMLRNNQYAKNRGKPVAVQEVNVGASTSHVSSTVTRSLPSESSSENSGHTGKNVLNADFKSSPKISSSKRKSNKTGCNCTSDHPGSKTLQDLKKLFLSQEQCDVSIIVKGEEFQAHKAILIARSPVFASTFRNDMNEQVTGMVEIEDCDPSSFSDFLCFLYCGSVESISAENVFSLFTAAIKYDVQDLKSQCVAFMKTNLTVDTFCNTVTLAFQHLEKELLDLTVDFFAKHIQEIIVTAEWQSFVIKNPVYGNEIMIKTLVPNKK